MHNLHIPEHPLIRQQLSKLRHTETGPAEFRRLVRSLSGLLCYEAARDLAIKQIDVPTPMGQAAGVALAQRVGLVPILRAGLGMAEGALDLLPETQVWHIGLYRDEETLQPVHYYNKLPGSPSVEVCFILDPMLATGGSAVAAASLIKEWGVSQVKFVGLLGAPEGVEALHQAHPQVSITLGTLDERLNDIGFIVPGLGDAGDRQFATG